MKSVLYINTHKFNTNMTEFVIIYNNKEEHICINTKIFAKFTDIMDTKDDVNPKVKINMKNNTITITPDVDKIVLKLIANYIYMHSSDIEQEQVPLEKPLTSIKYSKIYKNKIDVNFFLSVGDDNINQLMLAAHALKMVTLEIKAGAYISAKIKEKYKHKDEDNTDIVDIVNEFTLCMSVFDEDTINEDDASNNGKDEEGKKHGMIKKQISEIQTIARSVLTGKPIVKKNKVETNDNTDDEPPPLRDSDDENNDE